MYNKNKFYWLINKKLIRGYPIPLNKGGNRRLKDLGLLDIELNRIVNSFTIEK
jgi:hypothetical protein